MGYSAAIKEELKYTSTTLNSPYTSEHGSSATIRVDGMVCINCAEIIESNLKKMKGVKHISVSTEDKVAQVLYDPDLLSIHSICSAIEELGFEATLPVTCPISSMISLLPVNPPTVPSQQSCVINIDGMTCSSCVGIIESHLRDMEAVESVRVLLKEKEGRVAYNAAVTSPQDLLVVIENLGYTVTHVDGMFIIKDTFFPVFLNFEGKNWLFHFHI